jgi:hypothetical protein
MLVRKRLGHLLALAAIGVAVPSAALAIDFDLKGSLGEAGFTHYAAPVSNPLFNETPYITTEARPMWLRQEIPHHIKVGNSNVALGGNIDVFAIQLRAAITQRLGFIASKDGWADVDFYNTLDDDEGFANLAFGFKYAVLAEHESNSLVTVGFKYEAPSGGMKTSGIRLQGQGDGLFDLFVAGARSFGPVGIEANLGTQVAIDQDKDTSFLHWAIHADYEVMDRVYPFVELNGYTPIEDGNRTALGVNGMDLVNMGSSNSDTVITAAPGLRVRLHDNVDLGFAFELPLTEENDLMDWRVNTDLVIHL